MKSPDRAFLKAPTSGVYPESRYAVADPKKDPEYLAWLHTLPCAVRFEGEDSGCYGPIHAHHAGSRGMRQKCPDREAIPLCFAHHQDGPQAVHRIGKNFWKTHGLNLANLIGELNRIYDLIREHA